MKKNLLLIGLLAFSVSCISQPPKNNSKMNTERLTYFSFSHHNTMARFNGEKYEVSTEKDGRIHIIIDEGFPQEKDFYIDDSTIFDELLAIVKQYKMDKYKSDYRPEMQVFDGDSWSLYYKYDTKRSVSSGGYMAWPDNYREARHAISEYFQKWRDYPISVKEINVFQLTCKNNKGRDIFYRLERSKQETEFTIKNAEYDVDKQIAISNDYLQRLQELVNIYDLKREYNSSSDNEEDTNYHFLVNYSTGDTIDFTGYYSTYESGLLAAFLGFFDNWLPIRGNLVRLEYSYRITDFREIKYYVTKEDERFSLSHYDEGGNRHESKMEKDDVLRLQELVDSFGLDKAKDEFTGDSSWHLFIDYDSKDLSRIGGRCDNEASTAKAQHILNALTEFFAPYLQ